MKEAKIRYYNEKLDICELTFEDFVKLYINHRPALGITTEHIQHAFKMLHSPNMNKMEFMHILCNHGKYQY